MAPIEIGDGAYTAAGSVLMLLGILVEGCVKFPRCAQSTVRFELARDEYLHPLGGFLVTENMDCAIGDDLC